MSEQVVQVVCEQALSRKVCKDTMGYLSVPSWNRLCKFGIILGCNLYNMVGSCNLVSNLILFDPVISLSGFMLNYS